MGLNGGRVSGRMIGELRDVMELWEGGEVGGLMGVGMLEVS